MSTFVDVTAWPDEVKAGLLFDSTVSERHNKDSPQKVNPSRFNEVYDTFLNRYKSAEWQYYILVEE